MGEVPAGDADRDQYVVAELADEWARRRRDPW
jgi:hypothetical protein